jgi:hypothetical protein
MNCPETDLLASFLLCFGHKSIAAPNVSNTITRFRKARDSAGPQIPAHARKIICQFDGHMKDHAAAAGRVVKTPDATARRMAAWRLCGHFC